MAGDVLSQAEVESLLSAMESGALGETATPATAAASRPRPRLLRRWRPPKRARRSAPTTSSGRNGWARSRCGPCKPCTRVLAAIFPPRLSALLRSIVEVKLTSVDQLTYSEFVFSLENPTCFNLLRAAPLEGNLILDINPAIVYPIIDRLLGGGRESAPLARRPLTAIELRLVSRITDAVSGGAQKGLGQRARARTVGGTGRKQSAARADRAPERSRGADQLRADAWAICGA